MSIFLSRSIYHTSNVVVFITFIYLAYIVIANNNNLFTHEHNLIKDHIYHIQSNFIHHMYYLSIITS